MRISLRTSGGRGEYELAGSVYGHESSELYNRDLHFQLSPELIINSYSMVKVDKTQGKPRIRLYDGKEATHAHILFSSILLLPVPKRAVKSTPNDFRVIRKNKYSIVGINVDVATIDPITVLVPLEIYAGNTSPIIKKISFAERMALIQRLWSKADDVDSSLADLLREHKRIIHTNGFSHKKLQKIYKEIVSFATTDADPLASLFSLLGEYSIDPDDSETILKGEQDLEELDPTDTDDYIINTNINLAARWRKVLSRGSEGRKFSNYVKEVYGYRCLFTGHKYPKSRIIKTPGVDAAHILPWAENRVNSITNGICLDKSCHWAFDQGILRLEWNDGQYFLTIPTVMRDHLVDIGFDLTPFVSICGSVHKSWLPRDEKYWPSPDFIRELNSKLFPD